MFIILNWIPRDHQHPERWGGKIIINTDNITAVFRAPRDMNNDKVPTCTRICVGSDPELYFDVTETLEELGLANVLHANLANQRMEEIIPIHDILVSVTGTTASGKSTFLRWLLEEVPKLGLDINIDFINSTAHIQEPATNDLPRQPPIE